MGFLDRLNKAVDTVKAQVEQSGVLDKVKQATGQTQPGGAPSSPPPTGPQSVAEGADLADKKWWPTADDVTAIAGVAVGEPEDIETPDSSGLRFAGADARGSFVFEFHCVSEDSLVNAGSAAAWIDPRAGSHDRHQVIDGFGDYAVAAADGDTHYLCYAACGDALFYVDATSPGVDMGKAAERILRKLYDWPE